MRRAAILAASALFGGLLAGGACQAQTIEDHRFCSDTAANVVFYVDVTTPYDASDEGTLVSGIGQIFDSLQGGERLSIRTIEDTFANSERLLDMCVPFCPDKGFLANLFGECTEGVVINEKKRMRAAIAATLSHRLQSATELPKSEIVRTIALSADEEYRPNRQNNFYVFSDMLENSAYLGGSTFFSAKTTSLMSRLKADGLIPSLADADVHIFGFGRMDTPAHPALPQDRLEKVTAFWTAFFKGAGATVSLQEHLSSAN